jgi:hypothetical protein
MRIEFDGRPYELVYGSDSQRDGVYLELSDASGDEAVVIVDAFRWDPDGRITFSAYHEDVPLEIIEWFTAEVRRTMAPATPASDPPIGTPPSRPAG